MISYRNNAITALNVLLDVIASAFSLWCAILLAYDFSPPDGIFGELVSPFIVFTALFVLLQVIFKTYKYEYKFMSILEALKVLLVGFLCAIVILLLSLINIFYAPLSVTLVYLVIYCLSAILYRFSFRSVFVLRKMFGVYGGGKPPKNILIISDLNMAGLILRRLLQGQQLDFKPVMVLTDELGYSGKLHGVPVISDQARLKPMLRS